MRRRPAREGRRVGERVERENRDAHTPTQRDTERKEGNKYGQIDRGGGNGREREGKRSEIRRRIFFHATPPAPPRPRLSLWRLLNADPGIFDVNIGSPEL